MADPQSRSALHYLLVYLKGVGMGAADVVPGVSGGTVAFISGIYDELISSIRRVGPEMVQVLFKQGFAAFWRYSNASFLLSLVLGVFTSLLTLSKVVGFLLEQYPLPLWAFFFGLIVGSIVFLLRQHRPRSLALGVCFVVGTAVALGIAEIPTQQLQGTLPVMFFAGALALCAMILPGISGSFIMLLLGLYPVYIEALKTLDVVVLAVFISGGLLGLLSFSRLLSWLLHNLHEQTVVTMTGFLLGSLVMIWPWRNATEMVVSESGKPYFLAFENVLPGQYSALTAQDPQTLLCLCAMAVGLVLVLGLEWLGHRMRGASREV